MLKPNCCLGDVIVCAPAEAPASNSAHTRTRMRVLRKFIKGPPGMRTPTIPDGRGFGGSRVAGSEPVVLRGYRPFGLRLLPLSLSGFPDSRTREPPNPRTRDQRSENQRLIGAPDDGGP